MHAGPQSEHKSCNRIEDEVFSLAVQSLCSISHKPPSGSGSLPMGMVQGTRNQETNHKISATQTEGQVHWQRIKVPFMATSWCAYESVPELGGPIKEPELPDES